MFYQNAEHTGLEGLPEFKCALCDYTASKKYTLSKHRIKENGILNKNNEKHCYIVKSAIFLFFFKKAFFLSICTENIIVWTPSKIMSATYAITPSQ